MVEACAASFRSMSAHWPICVLALDSQEARVGNWDPHKYGEERRAGKLAQAGKCKQGH